MVKIHVKSTNGSFFGEQPLFQSNKNYSYRARPGSKTLYPPGLGVLEVVGEIWGS